MQKEIFDNEVAICRKLFHENGGKCHWGECDKCGVIPLLYKLALGQICETEKEVKEIKARYLMVNLENALKNKSLNS